MNVGREEFIKQFVERGQASGASEEEISKKLQSALADYDRVSMSASQQDKPNVLAELGKAVAKPAVKGIKMLELLGGSMPGGPGSFSTNEQRDTLPKWAQGLTYSPEELQKNFGGDTESERWKNTMRTGLQTSAAVGSYFVPAGQGASALGRVGNAAVSGGVENALRAISEDNATASDVAGQAVSGALTSGLFRGGFETAKGATNVIGNKLPEWILNRTVKPPTKNLQMQEVDRMFRYGEEKMGTKLAQQGKVPVTPEKIFSTAQENIDDIGPKIQKLIEGNGDKQVPVSSITQPLVEMSGTFMDAKEPELAREALKLASQIADDADDNAMISISQLYKTRDAIDETMRVAYNSGKGVQDLPPKAQLKMIATSKIRSQLADQVEGLSDLNEKYNFWKGVQMSSKNLAVGEMNRSPASDIVFAGGGLSLAGIPGFVSGIMFSRTLRSPSAQLGVSRFLQELGGAGNKVLNPTAANAGEKATRQLTNFLYQDFQNKSQPMK